VCRFEGVTADPLNSNPRAFSNTSTFDQNVYSSISNNNGAFSGTTTFDENLYASIGKNNGEIDRSGKAAENILYESSDKVQLPRESKSAVNALYAATNALFAATNGTSDRV
jgi:hypothetical protein